MTQPTITLFSKPNCPYCDRAKSVLQEQGLSHTHYDVKASQRNADASVYCSGVATVPQIFLGNYGINGSEDLARLHHRQRLSELLESIDAKALPIDQMTDEELHHGAEDMLLRMVIPQSDGSRDDDPQALPILRFYKTFFGFWPNTFAYLHHWPEAYKLFVYCHNFSAIGIAKEMLGPAAMSIVGYSTSKAHGCSYCQVHSAATGGQQSLTVVEQFKQAREGTTGDDNPFGPLEMAIADLAASATLNQVDPSVIAEIQRLVTEAHGGSANVDGYVGGALLVTSAFGFLNVFNDLTGLEVEGDWAQQASSQTQIDAGRHAAQASNPKNLDYDIPEDGPSIEDMLEHYDVAVGNVSEYAEREFGLTPAWIQQWPAPLRHRHAYLYGELMGDRPHTLIPAEQKHLMARVSAIAKGHDYLAAIEGYMAHHTAMDQARAVERVRYCFGAATGRGHDGGVFEEKEKAALTLAWLSAQVPLTTPRRFVQPAVEHYGPKALIHLIVTCAMASMVQRFVAAAQPQAESKVAEFLKVNHLEQDTLALRYPLPNATITV